MIAADTSTWIAFLQGESGRYVQLLDKALEDRQVVMAPAVLTELLSDPKLPEAVAQYLSEIPPIEIQSGTGSAPGCCEPKWSPNGARRGWVTHSSPKAAWTMACHC